MARVTTEFYKILRATRRFRNKKWNENYNTKLSDNNYKLY